MPPPLEFRTNEITNGWTSNGQKECLTHIAKSNRKQNIQKSNQQTHKQLSESSFQTDTVTKTKENDDAQL